MIKCIVCEKQFLNNRAGMLTRHLQDVHNISPTDYIIITEYGGIQPKCACGYCNKLPELHRGKFRKYAFGHGTFEFRKESYIKKYGMPMCQACNKEAVTFYRGLPRKTCEKCHAGGFLNPNVQLVIRKSVKEKYNVDNVFQLPELREQSSIRTKERWANGEIVIGEEWRKSIGISSKRKWENKDYRIRTSQSIKNAINSNEAELLRRSNYQKERLKDPNYTALYKGRLSKLHKRIRETLKLDTLGFISEQFVVGYFADELYKDKNVIVEINGDYVHANPKKYTQTDIIRLRGCQYTAQEKWNTDKVKIEALRSAGYTVIIIWESDNLEEKLNEIRKALNK